MTGTCVEPVTGSLDTIRKKIGDLQFGAKRQE